VIMYDMARLQGLLGTLQGAGALTGVNGGHWW
jgi:hypothetical protein